MSYILHDIIYIKKVLSKYRFSLNDEKALQLELQKALTNEEISFKKEYFLDKHNIVDFYAGDCVGIEVKIKGSKREIYKQILRYSKFDDIKSILLITNKSIGNPPLFEDKKLVVLNLGTAWL